MHDLIGRSGKKETGVPLIVTYYPRFHNLNNIRKHFTFLYAEEQVKSVFTPAPFVSFSHLLGKRVPFGVVKVDARHAVMYLTLFKVL